MLTITAAAEALGTSPRILRYRETLGLLPRTRPKGSPGRDASGGLHRRYGPEALAAAALVDHLEQRYDVTPAALSFALRVLAEPAVAADVHELGRLSGRLRTRPLDALDFEQEKARRLLGR